LILLSLCLAYYIGGKEGFYTLPKTVDFNWKTESSTEASEEESGPVGGWTRTGTPPWVTAARAAGKKATFSKGTKMYAVEFLVAEGPPEISCWESAILVGKRFPKYWVGTHNGKEVGPLQIDPNDYEFSQEKLEGKVDEWEAEAEGRRALRIARSATTGKPMVGGLR
jgi:hypothetical protein